MTEVTLKVLFKALDKNFQPAIDIFGRTLHYKNFPDNDTVAIKQQWIKNALREQVAHPDSAFFYCKVFAGDAVLFEYDDFFAEPDKRINIEWEWDETFKQGIGITTFADGKTVDPRSLIDFYTKQ